MGTTKLITFFDLLSDGYTVAQLASAVEAHGATGWDRFGRFGAFAPKSEGSRQALDALADYFDHVAKWLNAQSNDAFSDESNVLTGSPLDDLWDRLEIGIHRFGWLEGSVPSIDRSEEHPAVPWLSPQHGQPREATMLHMLGAILLYMEDVRKAGKTLLMPTQADLIRKLCGKHVGVTGISTSNLEKWFARARESVTDSTIPLKTP
jgi:hypothetical protein